MVHDLAPPWDELQCRLDDHDDELADSIDNIFGRVDELLGMLPDPEEIQ